MPKESAKSRCKLRWSKMKKHSGALLVPTLPGSVTIGLTLAELDTLNVSNCGTTPHYNVKPHQVQSATSLGKIARATSPAKICNNVQRARTKHRSDKRPSSTKSFPKMEALFHELRRFGPCASSTRRPCSGAADFRARSSSRTSRSRPASASSPAFHGEVVSCKMALVELAAVRKNDEQKLRPDVSSR